MSEALTTYIGGKNRTFPLLRVADIERLYSRLRLLQGIPQAVIVGDFDVLLWAKTQFGCAEIIAASLKRGGEELTAAEVMKWGSMAQRSGVASEIVARSLNDGEEVDPYIAALAAQGNDNPSPKVESGDPTELP